MFVTLLMTLILIQFDSEAFLYFDLEQHLQLET